MPTGPCRLCLQTKELRDSHLIPAAFYELMKTPGDKNAHPVLMSPKLQLITSSQVRGHLLCDACEQRFHKEGEAWVLKNCWRTDTEFKLREALGSVDPIERSPGSATFAAASIPGVDMDKLMYFAASIFWRGCLRGWRRTAGHVPTRLDLGPYEVGLRLFLLGGEFPADVVLVPLLGASTDSVHRGVTLPWLKGRDQTGRYHYHRFVVPGITFQMLSGRGIPASLRALCGVRSPERLIHASADVDEENLADSLRLYVKGRPGGKLRSKARTKGG